MHKAHDSQFSFTCFENANSGRTPFFSFCIQELSAKSKLVLFSIFRVFSALVLLTLFLQQSVAAATSAPHTFKVISRTPMTETNIYPMGTVKITYQSKVDGKNDWALFSSGDTTRNTVVYLHGSFSSGDQIYTRKDIRTFWLTRILKGNHPLLSINMRGTSYMSPAATQDFTDLLDYCRREYNLGKVILLGGSGGASSAMAYACVHPEHIDGIIAMGTCDIISRLEFASQSNIPVLQKLAKTVFAAYGGTIKERPELYRARSVLANADKLTMPIVLAIGEKDALIPVTETRRIAKALQHNPKFTYIEIPGGNHDSSLWIDMNLETLSVNKKTGQRHKRHD
ncbi:MAG: alpha/beta hydrolase [Kiritimatiellae bacterium]|jgi:pimeloyl-ACP methyl ester carboxylesterase|nr:alpha/beta hydrolase [Kiritimatiellia bacterium]